LVAVAMRLLGDRDETSIARSTADPLTIAPVSPSRESAPTSRTSVEAATPAPVASVPFREGDADAADDPDALQVFVIDEATGVAVAGAQVLWRQGPLRDDGFGFNSVWVNPGPPLWDSEVVASRTRTDARGVARIRTAPRLEIVARAEDRVGMRSYTLAPRGAVRIRIKSGFPIAAKVVDAEGTGVPTVPVKIEITCQTNFGGNRTIPERRGITRSPDGVVLFDHSSDNRGYFDDGFVKKARAALGEPWPSGDVWEATEDELRQGPIILQLPPAGRLSVELVGVDGRRLGESARVYLGSDGAAGSKPDRLPFGMIVEAPGGVATFDVVPSHAAFRVGATCSSCDAVIDSIAPLDEGEERVVRLAFRRPRIELHGRLIDGDGRPLASQSVNVDYFGPLGAPADCVPSRTSTDREGAFRLPVSRHLETSQGAMLAFDCESRRDASRVSGTIRIPKLGDAERLSLGDIVMSPAELLAAGTVVDDGGAPLAGALVALYQPKVRATGSVRDGPRTSGPLQVFEERSVKTDEAGAFAITLARRARFEEGVRFTFGLSAELDGYEFASTTTDLKPGATGVKIALTGAVAIEGRLLLPDEAPLGKLEIAVRYENEAGLLNGGEMRLTDCIRSDGGFRLTRVEPGTATIEVALKGSAEPLFRATGVVLRRLETNRDARLATIDLREAAALKR
jgi:protocatechuate 3,4-dioxygenase beta subunit